MTGFLMTRTWKCDLCGYVHNGTEAPQSCPVCGADIIHFSALEIQTSAAQETVTEAWQCSICDHIEHGSSPPNFCPICGAAAALFHPYVASETSDKPASINKLVILGAGIAGMTAAEEARADVNCTLSAGTTPWWYL